MIVKCGRKEYEVGAKDYIMNNGSCYQLMLNEDTGVPPRVAKTTFNTLLKQGKIVQGETIESRFGVVCTYYKFVI